MVSMSLPVASSKAISVSLVSKLTIFTYDSFFPLSYGISMEVLSKCTAL